VEDFWSELHEGEIHARDSLQFELKSEFLIHQHLTQNVYKQEVFIFIPSQLQINPQSYSKQQFYLDQTNLFRYRTPSLTLPDLLDPHYTPSPLYRLKNLILETESPFSFSIASGELKLFGTIFRAVIRERIYKIIQQSEQQPPESLDNQVHAIHFLCNEITQICQQFRHLQCLAVTRLEDPQFNRHFRYVDEVISLTTERYLLLLIKHLRSLNAVAYQSIDKFICQLVVEEKLYRKKHQLGPKTSKKLFFFNEATLYREGLLNRFILEALMLKSYRFSLEEKHSNILGATAAGIAMLVYMSLFAWKSSYFVINSFPFIAFAVAFYVLKDRLKEGLKQLYYKQAFRWFPDYSTEIRNSKKVKVGHLRENFAFIDPTQLPPGFLYLRNHHFHEELPSLQRHETIIQYKREVVLPSYPETEGKGRRRELTAIFRLNIYRFLQKASDAFEPHLALDPATQEVTEQLLPKVYHLNIIIRNTYLQSNLEQKSEIKTFRVVVDKVGIKRVEHIKSV
jgi:hypothetical protein